MGAMGKESLSQGEQPANTKFELKPHGRLSRWWEASALVKNGIAVHIESDFESNFRVHWGLSKEQGGQWVPPPYGWVTRPDVSYDAGGGAWQTPFENGKVEIHFGPNVKPFDAFNFVVCDSRKDQWYKTGSGDLYLVLRDARKHIAQTTSNDTGIDKGNEGRRDSQRVEDDSQIAEEEKKDTNDDAVPERCQRKEWSVESLARDDKSDGFGPHRDGIQFVRENEHTAERSLMHRFNLVNNFVKHFGGDPSALTALAVWTHLSASRRLRWNHNYNVKPREIARAQNAAASELVRILFESSIAAKDPCLISLAGVGRGGSSEMGQSIREEILIVQRRNDCKGGFMEEWHQKLHNNSSPDDVLICEALLAFIDANGDVSVYWEYLNKRGIDKARLKSFDRAIVSEPKPELLRSKNLRGDLVGMLNILKAVHDGQDLLAASEKVIGCVRSSRKANVTYPAIPGIDISRIQYLIKATSRGEDLRARLEACLELRAEIFALLEKVPKDRIIDLVFLDMALETTFRTLVEAEMSALRESGTDALDVLLMSCENAARSLGHNRDILSTYSMLKTCVPLMQKDSADSSLRTLAAVDRVKVTLMHHSERFTQRFQETAQLMCQALKLGDENLPEQMIEELARNSSLAVISLLLGCILKPLKKAAGQGDWEILSSFSARGRVREEKDLSAVEGVTLEENTILLVERLVGHEDIPVGCVAIVIVPPGDAPDLLSHVAVRARNEKVLLVACGDERLIGNIKSNPSVSLEPSPDGTQMKVC